MRIALALVFSLGLFAGCAPPIDLLEVEHPDPSLLDRDGEARARALRARLSEEGSPKERAQGWGELGEIYQAYRLDRVAERCLENARRLEPEEFRWVYALGYVRERSGKLAGAADAWKRALELRGGDSATLVRLGDVELRLGRLGSARNRFSAVLWRPELTAVGEFGLGRVAAAEGKPEEAIDHFERALELQPEATEVHYPLGLCYRDLGRFEEAERHLYRGTRGTVSWPDPDADRLEALSSSAGGQLRRAGRALVAGNLEGAVDGYEKALALDPGLAEARRNLALALQRSGRHAEAAAQLRTALELSPDDVWLLFDLGNVLQSQGDLEGALSLYRRAVEVAPDFARAHFNLANALMRAGRWRAALEPLARVIEIDSTHRRGRYLQGMALYQSGQRDDGRERMASLLEDEPKDPVAREGLVTLLREEGRIDEARSVLAEGEAWAKSPAERARLLRWRGDLERDAGRLDEAGQAYEEALRLTPAEPLLLAAAGQLDLETGDLARARERLEGAERLSPGDPAVLLSLARILAGAPNRSFRDGARALAMAQALTRLKPSLEHGEVMALALHEVGRTAEAVTLQERLSSQAAGADRVRLERNLAHMRKGEMAVWSVP